MPNVHSRSHSCGWVPCALILISVIILQQHFTFAKFSGKILCKEKVQFIVCIFLHIFVGLDRLNSLVWILLCFSLCSKLFETNLEFRHFLKSINSSEHIIHIRFRVIWFIMMIGIFLVYMFIKVWSNNFCTNTKIKQIYKYNEIYKLIYAIYIINIISFIFLVNIET